jgi:chromosome segregation ATPase
MPGTEEITRLRNRIQKLESDLIKFRDKVKNAYPHLGEIQAREQELKEIRKQLQACQQTKEKIQQQLTQKIQELADNSTERQLLLTNRHELDLVQNQLIQAWFKYNTQSDQIVDYLLKPCAICANQAKSVRDLTQIRNWLLGLLTLLIIALFLLILPRKTKKYENSRLSK